MADDCDHRFKQLNDDWLECVICGERREVRRRFTGKLEDFKAQARHSTARMTGQRPPFGHGNMLRDTASNTIQPCARCGVPIAGGGVCASCDLEDTQSLMDKDSDDGR